MLEFLAANIGTVAVMVVLIAVLILIVLKIRRDKKTGKACSCGGGCEGCPSKGMCHTNDAE